MKICPRLTLPKNQGFTLVEMMVTMVLIIALLYFLITTVSQTQAVMTRTTEKVAQFQSARSGFEAMTRRLSQATLNTYWRAHDNDITTATTAFKFRRQSELHFISGPTKRFLGPPHSCQILLLPWRRPTPPTRCFSGTDGLFRRYHAGWNRPAAHLP